MAGNSSYLAELTRKVGCDFGPSDWVTVDQNTIQQFADCTRDHQWIHLDVDRARRESPFGTTIAHGYLALSLLPQMFNGVDLLPGSVSQVFNYGIDRLRFISPVKSGARIRAHMRLLDVEEKQPGQFRLKVQTTLEIEGEEKPALVAELLSMAQY